MDGWNVSPFPTFSRVKRSLLCDSKRHNDGCLNCKIEDEVSRASSSAHTCVENTCLHMIDNCVYDYKRVIDICILKQVEY
mgnify:CR=1 FL=1